MVKCFTNITILRIDKCNGGIYIMNKRFFMEVILTFLFLFIYKNSGFASFPYLSVFTNSYVEQSTKTSVSFKGRTDDICIDASGKYTNDNINKNHTIHAFIKKDIYYKEPPNWFVTTGLLNNMSFYGFVKINNNNAVDGGVLGAFAAGDESDCRGKADIANHGGALNFYMMIGSDTNNEKIFFKLWDKSSGIIYDIKEQILFQADDSLKTDLNAITTDIEQYSITPTSGTGGNIYPSEPIILNKGALQVFTFTPDKAYEIADILIDDISIGVPDKYTFDNINKNHSIHAVFKEKYSEPPEIKFFTLNNNQGVTNKKVIPVEIQVSEKSPPISRWLITESSQKPTVADMKSGNSTSIETYSLISFNDGIKSLYAWVMDEYDNISNFAVASIKVDTSTILTINHDEICTTNNSILLQGTREEGSIIQSKSLSSATFGQVTYPDNLNWKIHAYDLVQGENIITIKAVDQAENVDEKQISIRYSIPKTVVFDEHIQTLAADGQSKIQMGATIKDYQNKIVCNETPFKVFTSLGDIIDTDVYSLNGKITFQVKSSNIAGIANISVQYDGNELSGHTSIEMSDDSLSKGINLNVDYTPDGVNLKWFPLFINSITYHVFRSRFEDGIYAAVSTYPIDNIQLYAGGFTDAYVNPGETWYYKVKAYINNVPDSGFSNTIFVNIPKKNDYEIQLLKPGQQIMNVGSTINYEMIILPLENYNGSINLSCSGLPNSIYYKFYRDGKYVGSSIGGIDKLPSYVKLEITASTASPIGEQSFNLLSQNVWEGGSSEQRSLNLMLNTVKAFQNGIHMEIEKDVIFKGESVNIYGAIVPHIKNKIIKLNILDETGKLIEKTTRTKTGGKFIEENLISGLGIGSFNVYASWIDELSSKHESNQRNITVIKSKSLITCTRIDSNYPDVNSDITISGTLKPALDFEKIIIKIISPDNSFKDISIYTDEFGHYQIMRPFCTQKGVWKFKAYWQGNDEAIGCESEFLPVLVGIPGKVIILAGGEASNNNLYWKTTKKLSINTFINFKKSGFTDNLIHFMINSENIDIDHDDVSDSIVNNTKPTVNDFINIFSSEFVDGLGHETPLFIYMQGHGTSDARFKVLGYDQFLSASKLRLALDSLQKNKNCTVIIIIESCYSGNFINYLSSQNYPNRVILTSAGNEVYQTDSSGMISFSNFLFSSLTKGNHLKDAYEYAKYKLSSLNFPIPQLDDNGDGKFDNNDGMFASNFYLPSMQLWGIDPHIQDFQLDYVLENFTFVPISVKVIQGDYPIERVWVQVIQPNHSSVNKDAAISFAEITLNYDFSSKNYKGIITNLTQNGIYTIQIYAMDSEHNISEPVTSYIHTSNIFQCHDLNNDNQLNLKDIISAIKYLCDFNDNGNESNLKIKMMNVLCLMKKVVEP